MAASSVLDSIFPRFFTYVGHGEYATSGGYATTTTPPPPRALRLPVRDGDRHETIYITVCRDETGRAVIGSLNLRTLEEHGPLLLTTIDARRLGYFLLTGEEPPRRFSVTVEEEMTGVVSRTGQDAEGRGRAGYDDRSPRDDPQPRPPTISDLRLMRATKANRSKGEPTSE